MGTDKDIADSWRALGTLFRVLNLVVALVLIGHFNGASTWMINRLADLGQILLNH
jgi:hypothetical protein